jgi:hypothetical protein
MSRSPIADSVPAAADKAVSLEIKSLEASGASSTGDAPAQVSSCDRSLFGIKAGRLPRSLAKPQLLRPEIDHGQHRRAGRRIQVASDKKGG